MLQDLELQTFLWYMSSNKGKTTFYEWKLIRGLFKNGKQAENFLHLISKLLESERYKHLKILENS